MVGKAIKYLLIMLNIIGKKRRKKATLTDSITTNVSPPVPIVKGTVVGVYMPSAFNDPLPVIGTTTDSVDNIGVCQSSDFITSTTIDCVSEPMMVLHVEATIGM